MSKAFIVVTENGKRVFVGVSHIAKIEGTRIFLDCCISPKNAACGTLMNSIIHTDQTEEELEKIVAAAIYDH